MPSAPALRAARALNIRTHAILEKMGVPTGPLEEASHVVTATMIDENTALPGLLAALETMARLATSELWNTGVMKPEFGRALREARAVLDKAEGRT